MKKISQDRVKAARAREGARKKSRLLALALFAAALAAFPAGAGFAAYSPYSVPSWFPLSAAATPSIRALPSSPAIADLCLPLLKASHTDMPDTVMDQTRRNAGDTAAKLSVLSLALGVRYALGPRENTALDTGAQGEAGDMASADTREARAVAVAHYRECARTRALEAIAPQGSLLP